MEQKMRTTPHTTKRMVNITESATVARITMERTIMATTTSVQWCLWSTSLLESTSCSLRSIWSHSPISKCSPRWPDTSTKTSNLETPQELFHSSLTSWEVTNQRRKRPRRLSWSRSWEMMCHKELPPMLQCPKLSKLPEKRPRLASTMILVSHWSRRAPRLKPRTH